MPFGAQERYDEGHRRARVSSQRESERLHVGLSRAAPQAECPALSKRSRIF
jgi:hypothetical protein